MKVGLVGIGYWGSILKSKLEQLNHDVVFACGSTGMWESRLKDVDWIFIATPNDTHRNIIKTCLTAGKNVFCEKPMVMSHYMANEMYELADKKGVKLYVDDVFNYRFGADKIKSMNWDSWKAVWKKYGRTEYRDYHRASIPNFMYHDAYLLYNQIGESDIENIDRHDIKNKLHFTITFTNGKRVEFEYDRNYDGPPIHYVGSEGRDGYDFTKSDEDVLPIMIQSVLDNTADFDYNRKITMFAEKLITITFNTLLPTAAVIGGGIFGTTAAWKLAKAGYNVSIFESSNDIMTGASFVNQYRLHRGYHYPRSKETALSCLKGEQSFRGTYGMAVHDGDDHYYCISKNDSLVSAEQYLEFLDEVGLEYEIVDNIDIVNSNEIDLIVKVNESLFNPHILTKLVKDKLRMYDVKVNLSSQINSDRFDNVIKGCYDHIVIATYSKNNTFINPPLDNYQFEVCEKPIVKLPESFKGKSVVIMDGPFMCIDPLGMSGHHVMGNVVHAIHETNIGKFPEVSFKMNQQIAGTPVVHPEISNVDKFVKSAQKFFNGIEDGHFIASMFTVRTVLPKHEYDDARPSIIKKYDNNIYTIFSGKIDTCIDIADELVEKINEQ